MEKITYCAAWMDAETGGNKTYAFEAKADLFEMPASEIVDVFIKNLEDDESYASPITYQLDSATNKKKKEIVLATGSLILARGEIPFLLMISPQIRASFS